MTTGAVPPLLEADRLRVTCCTAPRPTATESRRPTRIPPATTARLMVRCPVFKEHLICLIADDEDAAGSGVQARGRGEALRRLVRDNPHHALGISGPHPLSATAEAYTQATHALAAARTTSSRVLSTTARLRWKAYCAAAPPSPVARYLAAPPGLPPEGRR
ncbi:hypothetical protein [Nonomuraea sp. CA-141351]|uniref:hypothetical protein n=1 Tax=Nonomuraea sp. CA-141351 TaxID=3239996 RepID=UPI003D8F0970